ncbi:MAG TPA: L-histidine N(alpha)-methyltransferase [Bryobacteraceae bacterium]|jgi:dimethylhistidine N-methyltransferase
MFATAVGPPPCSQFAADVLAGLMGNGRKTLPSRYLYDEIGSTLFEVLTLLPEYGLTRADSRLLALNAPCILAELPRDLWVVELGSGSGTKTRHILEAAVDRQKSGTVRYFPIDISPAALHQCRRALETISGVEIRTLEATYLQGLGEAVERRSPGQAILLLFLGSTIGNFSPSEAREFLRQIRLALQPGDALLLGTDLVKPRKQLLEAYDDPIGATAAFNLNLLARINRELGGEFDLRSFRHRARWDEKRARIEMHLESRIEQQVRIADLDRAIEFRRRETIWTESSHKFRPEQIVTMAERAHFECRRQWIDADWPFAENLLIAR